MGEGTGSAAARSGGNCKRRILLAEAISEGVCRGGDGELPLFFASSPDSADSRVFEHADAPGSIWPGSTRREIAGSWARSFRLSREFDESCLPQHVLAGRGRPWKRDSAESVSSARSEGFVLSQLSSGSRAPRRSPAVLHSRGFASGSGRIAGDYCGRVECPPTDRGVRGSMSSEVVSRRLRDLKAHPSSPRIMPEDELSGFPAAGKVRVADIRQRLKPLKRSSPNSAARLRERKPELCELETTEIHHGIRLPAGNALKSCTSPPASQTSPLPTSPPRRFRDHGGGPKFGHKIVDIRKHSRILVREEELPETRTIAAAVDRALARRPSRDGSEARVSDAKSSPECGRVDRASSLRYYSGALARGWSFKQPSEAHSAPAKETLLDLSTPAAAKFVLQCFDRSPSLHRRHSSSPTFLVPFKWEDAPGKAKHETAAVTDLDSASLQLPPRLAAPRRNGASSSRRHSRISSMCTNFFMPCLAPASATPVISLKASHRHSRSQLPLEEGCHESHDSRPPITPEVELCNSSSPASILGGPSCSSQTSWSSTAMFSSGELEELAPRGPHLAPVSEPVTSSSVLFPEEDDAGLLLEKKAGAPTSSEHLNCEGEEPRRISSPEISPTVQAAKDVTVGSELAADVNGSRPSPSRPRRRMHTAFVSKLQKLTVQQSC